MAVAKKKLVNILVLMVIMLCSAIFTFAFINIITWYRDNRATEEMITETQNSAHISNGDDDKTKIIGKENADKFDPYWDYIKFDLLQVDFQQLKQKNNDTVGWVMVPGTNINYPFVQAKDNDYYLHHSFDKSVNSAGWVFLDYRNNIKRLDQNTILYAHGRYDMTMFGSLREIMDSGWTNNSKNHVVKLSTEEANTLWQVFSIYHIPTTTDYLYTNFTSENSYGHFLKMLADRSTHNFNTSLSTTDKILTLSTCYNKQERMVLHAKLIKRQTR